ncbi:hypothetical protein ACR2V0_28805, partial [Klebsiella pneumoniae]
GAKISTTTAISAAAIKSFPKIPGGILMKKAVSGHLPRFPNPSSHSKHGQNCHFLPSPFRGADFWYFVYDSFWDPPTAI